MVTADTGLLCQAVPARHSQWRVEAHSNLRASHGLSISAGVKRCHSDICTLVSDAVGWRKKFARRAALHKLR